MRAFQLEPDRQVELFEIATQMKKEGLPSDFISEAIRTALEFEGVYDLVQMWSEETDKTERGEITADIQDMINDCSQAEKVEGAYIRFDDLESVAKNVRAFKDNLRVIIDKKGGIKKLCKLTGIPQPSLSRFFSSTSIPHRSTLLKIANALKLDAVKIATEWTRQL